MCVLIVVVIGVGFGLVVVYFFKVLIDNSFVEIVLGCLCFFYLMVISLSGFGGFVIEMMC